MTRLVRLAASAVLVALYLCAHSASSWAAGIGQGAARLEPARLFDPLADSLFAGVTSSNRSMSPLETALFHVPPAIDLALTPIPSADVPSGAGMATVRFGIPRIQVAFTRYPETAAPVRVPSPRVEQAPAKLAEPLPAPPEGVAEAAALRTAPPATVTQSTEVRFGSYAPYTPQIEGLATGLSVPGRLGNVQFETAFDAMQVCGTTDEAAACASNPDANSQRFTAGTDFRLRTGASALKLGLSSSIEHLDNASSGMFPYVPLDPDAQAGLTYFGLTNVVSQSVGAQVDVPVNRHITVGLQYDRAHYQGDYANTLLPGFDASKDTYLGNITYQLPNTSSAITLSTRQYRYQDAFAPNFNLTQTRTDLNFTVKF